MLHTAHLIEFAQRNLFAGFGQLRSSTQVISFVCQFCEPNTVFCVCNLNELLDFLLIVVFVCKLPSRQEQPALRASTTTPPQRHPYLNAQRATEKVDEHQRVIPTTRLYLLPECLGACAVAVGSAQSHGGCLPELQLHHQVHERCVYCRYTTHLVCHARYDFLSDSIGFHTRVDSFFESLERGFQLSLSLVAP